MLFFVFLEGKKLATSCEQSNEPSWFHKRWGLCRPTDCLFAYQDLCF